MKLSPVKVHQDLDCTGQHTLKDMSDITEVGT